jgi:hypothetical protein
MAVFKDNDDAVFHNEALVNKIVVVLLILLVHELDVLTNSCVLVNDTLL